MNASVKNAEEALFKIRVSFDGAYIKEPSSLEFQKKESALLAAHKTFKEVMNNEGNRKKLGVAGIDKLRRCIDAYVGQVIVAAKGKEGDNSLVPGQKKAARQTADLCKCVAAGICEEKKSPKGVVNNGELLWHNLNSKNKEMWKAYADGCIEVDNKWVKPLNGVMCAYRYFLVFVGGDNGLHTPYSLSKMRDNFKEVVSEAKSKIEGLKSAGEEPPEKTTPEVISDNINKYNALADKLYNAYESQRVERKTVRHEKPEWLQKWLRKKAPRGDVSTASSGRMH